MRKDKNDLYFAKGKICGSLRQLTITILRNDWKYFNVGSRIKILNKNNYHIIKKVLLGSGGQQRYVNIPKEDWDLFKKGEKVKLYPEKQPKVSKSQ